MVSPQPSPRPAILASAVTPLQIEGNRIAMESVSSSWPAVWVTGREIRVVHNWLGIQSTAVDREWLPVTVTGDLAADTKAAAAGTTGIQTLVPVNPGGIQIAGSSRDVFVVENEIDSAGRNGITLGGVSIIGSKGNETGTNGVTIEVPGPGDTTVTLTMPAANQASRARTAASLKAPVRTQ